MLQGILQPNRLHVHIARTERRGGRVYATALQSRNCNVNVGIRKAGTNVGTEFYPIELPGRNPGQNWTESIEVQTRTHIERHTWARSRLDGDSIDRVSVSVV